jgi:hypothetical protein
MVPAQGFEPWTIGLKVRYDLRGMPPHGSCRIRFSASRLLAAPATAPAWLYKLAIHPKALSESPGGQGAIRPECADTLVTVRGRWLLSTLLCVFI